MRYAVRVRPAVSAGGARRGHPRLSPCSAAFGRGDGAGSRRAGCGGRAAGEIGSLAALLVWLGGDDVFSQIATFFPRLALVTFGAAYAVLGYVAQQGVEQYGWLAQGEMLDGLGLAETTPGPLILVTQFVGFLAALRGSGAGAAADRDPGRAADDLGDLPAPFLPPSCPASSGSSPALAAITAAVVGGIANLALWFAFNLLFVERIRWLAHGADLLLPIPASAEAATLALTALAFMLVFALRLGVLAVLGICAALGCGWVLWSSG